MDYFVGQFGSSFWMEGNQENRQVPLRLMTKLVSTYEDALKETKFQNDCINCWFSSSVDHAITIQHSLTNQILTSKINLKIFQNLPKNIMSLVPFSVSSFIANRENLIEGFFFFFGTFNCIFINQ